MLFVLNVFLAFILELHILFDCSGRVFPGGIVEGDRKIRDIATGDRVSHKSSVSKERQEGREQNKRGF